MRELLPDRARASPLEIVVDRVVDRVDVRECPRRPGSHVQVVHRFSGDQDLPPGIGIGRTPMVMRGNRPGRPVPRGSSPPRDGPSGLSFGADGGSARGPVSACGRKATVRIARRCRARERRRSPLRLRRRARRGATASAAPIAALSDRRQCVGRGVVNRRRGAAVRGIVDRRRGVGASPAPPAATTAEALRDVGGGGVVRQRSLPAPLATESPRAPPSGSRPEQQKGEEKERREPFRPGRSRFRAQRSILQPPESPGERHPGRFSRVPPWLSPRAVSRSTGPSRHRDEPPSKRRSFYHLQRSGGTNPAPEVGGGSPRPAPSPAFGIGMRPIRFHRPLRVVRAILDRIERDPLLLERRNEPPVNASISAR